MSTNVIKTAYRLARFLDIDDDTEIKKIIKWLILYRNSRMIHAYIETQQPVKPLLTALRNNKELQFAAVS